MSATQSKSGSNRGTNPSAIGSSVVSMTTATALQPFKIEITDSELQDLHRRLDETRWPDPAPDARTDFARGALDYLQELTDLLAPGLRLAGPGSPTQRDPAVHRPRSTGSRSTPACPLPSRRRCPVDHHGYPSSVVEFLDMIGRSVIPGLTAAIQETRSTSVIPSVPGFGFSTPADNQAGSSGRTTAAFAELMARLGYSRYGAHGGDIGAGISGRPVPRTPRMWSAHRGQRPWFARAGRGAVPDSGPSHRGGASARRAGAHDLARGTRLPRFAGPPARDDRGSLDRLTGRSACLDCREVPDLDQPGVASRTRRWIAISC